MRCGHEKGLTPGQLYVVLNMKNLRKRCWEKTGCFMTADGSGVNRITPKGLKDYNSPPLFNIPSVGAEPELNLPDSSDGEDEDHEEVLDGDIEHPPNEVL